MENRRTFQIDVGDRLHDGASVLQVAPTGLGKTRGAVLPFVDSGSGPLLNTRLLYALPLRSLGEAVRKEIEDRAPNHKVAVHHGGEAESYIFSEAACVTTIDQYLAAFAGAPLSSFTDSTTNRRVGRVKVGHAVAGAVLTSYSVFDEVHLLDPRNGLQLLMAVLGQRRRWGLLSTVSTATLPSSVIEYLTEDDDGPGLTLVAASESDIAQRDAHRSVTLETLNNLEPVGVDEIAALCASNTNGKTILFANTVDRAITYYQALKERLRDQVMLIHSRFASDDRREKEGQVQKWFGEKSVGKSRVLVTTQVSEAGLNISASLVVSELCPADSLVQRAGRCARFVPADGRVVVFKPEVEETERGGRKNRSYWLPYPQAIIKRTEDALESFAGVLDWPREQSLVNTALGELYGKWVRGENVDEELDNKGQIQSRSGRLRPVDALGPFERSFRARSPDEVESWLRNPEGRPLAVQIAVAESADDAQKYVTQKDRPNTVQVPFGVLVRRLDNDKRPRLWEIDPSRAKLPSPLDSVFEIQGRPIPGRTYLILASEAGYSAEFGLRLNGAGQPLGWNPPPRGERYQEQGNPQTFNEHATGAHRQASRLSNFYTPFIEAWSASVFGEMPLPSDVAGALTDAMLVAALFHDVGKLGTAWQEMAGRKEGGEPVARFPRREGEGRLPSHAPFAYPFLRTLFRLAQDDEGFLRIFDFIALAAARHHSLGVDGAVKPGQFEAYDPADALAELIKAARDSNTDIDESIVRAAFERISDKTAWDKEPYYADEAPGPSDDLYPIYCIAQRLVKVADWEDAGQGRTIELASKGGDES